MNVKTTFGLLETDEAVLETIDKLTKQSRLSDVKCRVLRMDPASATLAPAFGTGASQTVRGMESRLPRTNPQENRLEDRLLQRFNLTRTTAQVLAAGLRRGALLIVLDTDRHHAAGLHRLLQRAGARIVTTIDGARRHHTA